MPGRITPLVNDMLYHVYNRGAEKKVTFLQPRDFKRFIKTLYYYQYLGPKPSFSKFSKLNFNSFKPELNKKIVDIICYCLMPNHFHLLVKQLKDHGISIFVSQVCNSYTKYFNTKYLRVGALLQGVFKAELIESDEQLLHVSRYIHLNPIVSGLTKNLNNYPYSSYQEFIYQNQGLCNTTEILNFFSSPKKYQEFVEDQIDYGTTLEILKHRTIDIDG